MLKLDPIKGPGAVVQTTAGCLGQIGMNEAGIGIGINNLTSYGKPGVTWNFVVRKALQQTDFDDAVECVLDAELAGGHNYTLIGPDGKGVNVEAMPGSVSISEVEDSPFVHSNHCLDLETIKEEGPRTYEYQEDSLARLEAGMLSATDLASFFADPMIARRAADPDATATCGAVVMRPADRQLDSVWGFRATSPGDISVVIRYPVSGIRYPLSAIRYPSSAPPCHSVFPGRDGCRYAVCSSGPVVLRGDLNMSAPSTVSSLEIRRTVSRISRELSPPGSGVPVPGARPGSTTSMSIEMKTPLTPPSRA